MTLTPRSRSFNDGQTLPKAFVHHAMGAGGNNLSPELEWDGVPAGARSFSLTMYDPDAPIRPGSWHWVVFDIPADTRALAQGLGAAGGAELPAARSWEGPISAARNIEAPRRRLAMGSTGTFSR